MEKKWNAQVWIKWDKAAPMASDWSWMKDWKEVKWAASTMGEWDMALWVDVDTPDQLEDFIHTKLRSKDWVDSTQSTWAKEVWCS